MTNPPFIPGLNVRFRSPGPRVQAFERMMRERVQEQATGLYLFEVPAHLAGTPLFSVVEAYTAGDGLREATIANLDPYRFADMQRGDLVCVGTLDLSGSVKFGEGLGSVHILYTLDEYHLDELRRNNRNARRDLKRKSSGHARAREMHGRHNARAAAAEARFADFYEQAMRDTIAHAMGMPRVNVL